MNRDLGETAIVLRNGKPILAVEEITSDGRCGSSLAVFLCPASACLYGSVAWVFFIICKEVIRYEFTKT